MSQRLTPHDASELATPPIMKDNSLRSGSVGVITFGVGLVLTRYLTCSSRFDQYPGLLLQNARIGKWAACPARLRFFDRECRIKARILQVETVLFNTVIGIDVHKNVLVCCAMWSENGELKTEKCSFKTFKNGKKEMASWCASFHPDLVIMESTGVYWKSPYAFLEKVGIRPAIVNARHIHQLEGKKTDMSDAEWLAHVGRLGVFIRSFVPETIYRELRNESRYVLKLKDYISAEKNRFHKMLVDAGFNLSTVFSDLSGINAQNCIKGIMAGLDVEEIMKTVNTSRLRKATPEEIQDALGGHLSESHRNVLDVVQRHISFMEAEVTNLQAKLLNAVKNAHPDALMFLQTIPGVSEQSAVTILIELGGEDLNAFKTAEYLASWIGVCPGNNESAGKRRHGHIRKGNYYLRRALCECAQAAVRTKGTTFQGKYVTLRVRKGTKRAIIAIVHKIVQMIYFVLTHKREYRDPKIDYEAELASKNARRWVKLIATLDDWEIDARELKTGKRFTSSNTIPPASTSLRCRVS